MDKLQGFIAGVVAFATPANIATVKAIISSVQAMGNLRKDNGDGITADELDAIWDEAGKNFKTLGDAARASAGVLKGVTLTNFPG
jgi:hypothetical protein